MLASSDVATRRCSTPPRDHERAVRIDERRVVGAAGGAHVAGIARLGPDGDVGEDALAGGLRLERADLRAHLVIGGVEHRDGAGRLVQVGERLELGVAVRLERAVPFQVVRRDVEQHRRIGREPRGGFQLVGRGLRDEDARGIGRDGRKARVADVADRDGVHPRRTQKMCCERGDRGLAVGAGDGDPARCGRALAPGELDSRRSRLKAPRRGNRAASTARCPGWGRTGRIARWEPRAKARRRRHRRTRRRPRARRCAPPPPRRPPCARPRRRTARSRGPQKPEAVVGHRGTAFAQAEHEDVAEGVRPAADRRARLLRAHASSPPSGTRRSR